MNTLINILLLITALTIYVVVKVTDCPSQVAKEYEIKGTIKPQTSKIPLSYEEELVLYENDKKNSRVE